MQDILSLSEAGPVAILLAILVILAKVAHSLLNKLIEDKDKQIDRLTTEIGVTLDSILTAIKDQAAERRPKR